MSSQPPQRNDEHPAGEQDAGTADAATSLPADAGYRCDLCGAPMQEWHCRIICTFCGYQRDCSDP